MYKGIFLSAISLLLSCELSAGVYKWVDESGQVHYSDKPPISVSNKTEEIEIQKNSEDAESVERLRRMVTDAKSSSTGSKVKNRASSLGGKSGSSGICEHYQKTYETYKKDGVEGINMRTNERKMMTGKVAEQEIKRVKERIELLCN
ncbi:DUF4124 domain-containing protein [Thalassolituus oleivorans]|uniref:DUF4124 domain-containing protein n=1 Tax=Thalassolituus oleivorans MIL-1 TaxID=1298593 RepID=M5DTF5_9GAMM|nr:DUF4124 domain-containing protein [Thalassolituus oleivorans]CCU73186.1 hypothetical protein TOL_2790 [Thalassolituus oleivorans MIL-1]